MNERNCWQIRGLIVGLICGVWMLFACACTRGDKEIVSIPPLTDAEIADAKLTDAELIKEYEAAGLSVKGRNETKLIDDPTGNGATSHPNARLQAVRAEILQRGSLIVPVLIAFLEQEAPKEREKDPDTGLVISFTPDSLELLAQIGDVRGAPIALRILEGWDGKANKWKQFAALDALEKLTHFSFHKVELNSGNYFDAVEHPGAMDVKFFSEYAIPARLYRQWMEGEGKEPSKWAAMARQRAQQSLASDDLGQVYCAATFLRPSAARDDAPNATLARLAEIVGKMKKVSKQDRYELAGKPVPVSIADWTAMISDYGPRAQPYSAILLRIQKEYGLTAWSGYAQLRKIGGPEIMSFLFEVLPEVSAKADSIRKEAGEHAWFGGDDPRLAWLQSQREVQFGIDRWAGRIFDSDADRWTWWKANKNKSTQEWLTANLDVLNKQVAKGKLWARALAHEILPDMPGCALISSRDVGKRRIVGPFRVEWLAEHRKELRYDANAGCFRLTH